MTLSMVIAILASLNGVGLASTLIARVSLGTAWQSLAHGFFIFCLLMIGVLTPLSFVWGVAYCMACGTTLAVMAVTAVLDFERHRERPFADTSPMPSSTR